jgi:hypothetical protein
MTCRAALLASILAFLATAHPAAAYGAAATTAPAAAAAPAKQAAAAPAAAPKAAAPAPKAAAPAAAPVANATWTSAIKANASATPYIRALSPADLAADVGAVVVGATGVVGKVAGVVGGGRGDKDEA